MAGKHINITDNNAVGQFRANSLSRPPVYPGLRTDRAYAEGRTAATSGGSVGDNPFAPNFGWPEFQAWSNGFQGGDGNVNFANCQFQTNTPDP